MDEVCLRRELGNELFEKSSAFLKKNGVQVLYSADGVYVYRSGGHVVVRRVYPDRPVLFDCDCGTGPCVHSGAVRIFVDDRGPSEEVDPEVVADIEEDIDNFADDVLGDPDYDEENNCYEDWEREKYGIEDDNSDVEYDHTFGLCRRILDDVPDPHEAIRLLDLLQRSIESDFESDNGGFDSAFDDLGKEIAALFHFADENDVATVMSHGYSCWAEKYIKQLPEELVDKAYTIMRKSHAHGWEAMEMMFDRGDYEDYVESSSDSEESILKSAKALIGKGQMERARALCGKLPDTVSAFYRKPAAEVFSALGMAREAGRLYTDMYETVPSSENLWGVRRFVSEEVAERLLDEVFEKEMARNTLDLSLISHLLLEGRKDIVEHIRKVGFVPVTDRFERYDFSSAFGIVSELSELGMFDEAATIGRGVVSYRMNTRDPDGYGEGVRMLRHMDSIKGLENATVPHSQYLAQLRSDRKTMRKFWGLYDGTWTGKGSGRRYGYL